MLKKGKYWREFTAGSRAEAEAAAMTWWAEQSGFDKVCGWTLPAPAVDAAPQWTVTIVYKESGPEPGQATTVH